MFRFEPRSCTGKTASYATWSTGGTLSAKGHPSASGRVRAGGGSLERRSPSCSINCVSIVRPPKKSAALSWVVWTLAIVARCRGRRRDRVVCAAARDADQRRDRRAGADRRRHRADHDPRRVRLRRRAPSGHRVVEDHGQGRASLHRRRAARRAGTRSWRVSMIPTCAQQWNSSALKLAQAEANLDAARVALADAKPIFDRNEQQIKAWAVISAQSVRHGEG